MSNCGGPASIWKTAMGNAGACNGIDHPAPGAMSPSDQQLWTCSSNGDIELDMSKASPNAYKCLSWSTEGSCQFPMKKLVRMQAKLESNGCNGHWAAPLWITPQDWNPPQHKSGEIDLFERGCVRQDGYLTSFGENDPWIEHNTWQQQNQGNQPDSTALTAFVIFNPAGYNEPTKDFISIFNCPFDSNPIVTGDTGDCQQVVYRGYYQDTKENTHYGSLPMTLVSDLWNKKGIQCSSDLATSQCKFKVSDIKLQFSDDDDLHPWSPTTTNCDAIRHKVNPTV